MMLILWQGLGSNSFDGVNYKCGVGYRLDIYQLQSDERCDQFALF